MIELPTDANPVVVIEGDCLSTLARLQPGSFDAVLTDPPYGISAAKKKAHSSIRDDPAWRPAQWDDELCTAEVRAIAARGVPTMIWGGNYYADQLPASSGWLAWVKPEAGTGFSLADMELCWTSLPMAARVFKYARRDGNLHPTQKPVAVMRWCLSFIKSAAVILDPFAGSGTTGVAAVLEGRKAVLIERDPAYAAIARDRVAKALGEGPGSLFAAPKAAAQSTSLFS